MFFPLQNQLAGTSLHSADLESVLYQVSSPQLHRKSNLHWKASEKLLQDCLTTSKSWYRNMKSTSACIIRGKVFLKTGNRVQFTVGLWTNVQARFAGESVTAVNALGRGWLWNHRSPFSQKEWPAEQVMPAFSYKGVLCRCRNARAPPEEHSALTFQLFWVWDETQFSFQRIWVFYWNHCLLFLSPVKFPFFI